MKRKHDHSLFGTRVLLLTLAFVAVSLRLWGSSSSSLGCFSSFLPVAAAEVVVTSSSSNSHVVELTDLTFEHQTQSSTGQTTGKWFIMFYAPWCGHCQRLEPIWEELATKLTNEDDYKNEGIVISKIDMTESPKTLQRFNIQGFPTLLYFANRHMYTYKGKRDFESLLNFVLSDYQMTNGEKVPLPPSWMEEQVSNIRQTFMDDLNVNHLITDLEHIFKLRKNAAAVIGVLGIFIGFFFGFLFGGSYASRNIRQQIKLMMQKEKHKSNTKSQTLKGTNESPKTEEELKKEL